METPNAAMKKPGPAQSGSEHRAARAALLDPAAENRGGEAEYENAYGEDPAQLGKIPVAGR
jgi:hypothetical protein